MFSLTILTPDEVLFEGEVYSLKVPGSAGYLEVLKDHAPLMTTLKSGQISFLDKDKNEQFYQVEQGFLEVHNNVASLLVGAIARK